MNEKRNREKERAFFVNAHGRLKGCLFPEQKTGLKTPLREWREDGFIPDLIRHTLQSKAPNHGLAELKPRK